MKETTQLNTKKKKEISFYPFLSFVITFLCCVFLYYQNGVVPFGKQSLLYSDLKAQYAPFLILWKEHLLNLDFSDFVSSFTYSNKLGLGKNIMGTLGYYLASPLNLIVLFFKNSDIAIAVNFLVAIKLSLASAFMCLFLEKRIEVASLNGSSSFSRSKFPIVLGVLYSFTSYAIVFAFNIMWLDGYLLLPFLLYLLEVYIFEKKYKGIIITLILLFVSNFYIAYMVGIFSFIYLVMRLLELKEDKIDSSFVKEVLKACGKYAFMAVSCGLVSAVVLLPSAMDILANPDSIEYLSDTNRIVMFPILSMAEQFFLGRSGDFSYLMDNNPFVFASILTTCSVVIYFISDKFSRRIKLYRLVGLVFFFLACYVKVLNLVCHAFDMPNGFQHRFSFVIYPLLMIITLEVLLKIKEIKNRDIIISSSVFLLILVLSLVIPSISLNKSAVKVSLALLIVYPILMCLQKVKKWHPQLKDMPKLLPAFMAVLIISESVLLNTELINHSFFIPDLDDDVFSESISKIEVLNEGKVVNPARFRTEYECVSDGDCIPDALWGQANLYANLNGFSLFNTTYNRSLGRFIKQLGYAVNYNYFLVYYNYMMPSNDAFFSMGTLLSNSEYSLADLNAVAYISSSENTEKYGLDGIAYRQYDNNRVLPLAFPIDSKACDFDFYALERAVSEKNYFRLNELWYQSMFPEAFDYAYFKIIDDSIINEPQIIDGTSYVEVNSVSELKMATKVIDKIGQENLIDHMNNATNYVPSVAGKPVVIKYDFVMPESGELYFNLSVPTVSRRYVINVNGSDIVDYQDHYSSISRIGYFNQGDTVTLEIKADNGIAITDMYFAIFDQAAFNEQFDRIDTSAVTVNRFTNGHAELLVDTSKIVSNSLVLSSIPYEKGWTCYIDGKEAEITPYQNAFISVDLNKNNVNDGAQHIVELKFCAPGFKAGGICFIVGLILLLMMPLYDRLSVRKTNRKIRHST